jgi:pyruvate,orthophosphate dikinase
MSTDAERLVRFGPGSTTLAPSERFGNKASCLARMAALGLPVPPGFALSIDVCHDYFASGRVVPPYLADHVRQGISHLETATGLKFGNPRRPLLVSVRSGSPVSMPGMMTTVLNVGITREVLGVDPGLLDDALRATMSSVGAREQSEMDFRALRDLATAYERILRRVSGTPFPEDAREQLLLATRSVLDSWMSPRAVQFRERNHLDRVGGTAITIQAMVFGNLGRDSGAGVMFTRNPWNGENRPLIDFKLAVQGEDVVSKSRRTGRDDLARAFPDILRDLTNYGRRLEAEFRDMQDVEFTVEERRLYLLQTRSGAREPLAALRIALDLADEGRIGRDEARSRLAELDLDRIVVHEMPTPREPLAQGEPASLGFATGAVVFSPAEAVEAARHGPVILVKDDLMPDDLTALESAVGAVMPRGSRTSHAIVVARQMGKAVVVNCPRVEVDPLVGRFRVGETEVRAGDTISIDGATGRIYTGPVEFETRRPEELLGRARSLGLAPA